MHTPRLEVLESRIAPALFFVSGVTGTNALKVFNADGSNAQDTTQENVAAMLTHAKAAVSMAAGDALIFDTDGDHQYGAKDSVLLQVTQGSTLVFLTDGPGKRAGAFDPNEISGLAVGDGFRGVLFSDLNGPVVTGLDAMGNFTGAGNSLPLQKTSLAGLQVAGQINGAVLTGGSLAGLSAGAPMLTKVAPKAVKLSVAGGLATGSAASGIDVSFDGGTTKLTTSYAEAAGGNAGSISNVVLKLGTPSVRTGAGGPVMDGTGGAGGDIINVQLGGATIGVNVSAGSGGAVGNMGTGGRGGDIIAMGYQSKSAVAGEDLAIKAGNGGGAIQGVGGAGGKIASSTFVIGPSRNLELYAGNGGEVTGQGNGGVGGDFASVSVTILGGNVMDVRAGNGGNGGNAGGDGAAGGAMEHLRIAYTGKEMKTSFVVSAGSGGAASASGALGGRGGDLVDTAWNQVRNIDGASFYSGDGGNSDEGNAGAGGRVSGFRGTLLGVSTGSTLVVGSSGGQSSSGFGGASGSVDDVEVFAKAKQVSSLSINSGIGGSGGGNSGGGGASGSVSNIRIENRGTIGDVTVATADGGSYDGSAMGTSGRAGDMSDVSISNYGKHGTIAVNAGSGGALSGMSGNLGDGGNVSRVTFNDYFKNSDPFNVYTGSGKADQSALGDMAKGSNAGSISDVALNAPKTPVHVFAGAGLSGGSGAGSIGGDGGDVHNVSGVVGEITIQGGDGGGATHGMVATGGAGGDVSGIHFSSVGKFVRYIEGGNGGAAVTPGAGGSLSDIVVPGDIGDFKSTFGVNVDELNSGGPKMGGLIAGASPDASLNGSITGIYAQRIAAILAGTPKADSIGYGNAVSRLDSIFASVIGADTKLKGTDSEPAAGGAKFDFNEGDFNEFPGVFQPNSGGGATDGDVPLDGFVLVKASGLGYLSATPLKLITVM